MLLHAVVDGREDAQAWVHRADGNEIETAAPDLIWVEVTNALLQRVKRGELALDDVRARLSALLDLPIRSYELRELAAATLPRAVATGLNAYDSCYLVLAEALDAVLVTADRRLAEAALQAELLA